MAEEIKPESIEKSKLEWGPDLGVMTWDEAQIMITELNAGLIEGEKPWRLPTKDELLAEFNITGSTPAGFRKCMYWSSTTQNGGAYFIGMEIGNWYLNAKDNPDVRARLVRDAA